MGQEEIQKALDKLFIMTIHELQEKTRIGKRSLNKSLAKMRDHDEIIVIKIKNGKNYKSFFINPEIKCLT